MRDLRTNCRTSSTGLHRHGTGRCRVGVGSRGMGVAGDGLHGQRFIFGSTFTKLRHDSTEVLLHNTIRDGVGQACRQQRKLPAAERALPDLLIYLNHTPFLCDITVINTLADSNLATASKGAGLMAKKAAVGKVAKYQATADAMHAVCIGEHGWAERIGAAAHP